MKASSAHSIAVRSPSRRPCPQHGWHPLRLFPDARQRRRTRATEGAPVDPRPAHLLSRPDRPTVGTSRAATAWLGGGLPRFSEHLEFDGSLSGSGLDSAWTKIRTHTGVRMKISRLATTTLAAGVVAAIAAVPAVAAVYQHQDRIAAVTPANFHSDGVPAGYPGELPQRWGAGGHRGQLPRRWRAGGYRGQLPQRRRAAWSPRPTSTMTTCRMVTRAKWIPNV